MINMSFNSMSATLLTTVLVSLSTYVSIVHDAIKVRQSISRQIFIMSSIINTVIRESRGFQLQELLAYVLYYVSLLSGAPASF